MSRIIRNSTRNILSTPLQPFVKSFSATPLSVPAAILAGSKNVKYPLSISWKKVLQTVNDRQLLCGTGLADSHCRTRRNKSLSGMNDWQRHFPACRRTGGDRHGIAVLWTKVFWCRYNLTKMVNHVLLIQKKKMCYRCILKSGNDTVECNKKVTINCTCNITRLGNGMKWQVIGVDIKGGTKIADKYNIYVKCCDYVVRGERFYFSSGKAPSSNMNERGTSKLMEHIFI